MHFPETGKTQLKKIINHSCFIFRNKWIDIENASFKMLRKCFTFKKYDISKARMKYSDHFNKSEITWKELYMLPKKTSTNNKLIEMQYKVLHNFVATKKTLNDFTGAVLARYRRQPRQIVLTETTLLLSAAQ